MRSCLDSLSAHNSLESFGGDWPHLPVHISVAGAVGKSLCFPLDEKLGRQSQVRMELNCSLIWGTLHGAKELNS